MLFLIHAASMFTAHKRISASRCVKFSSAQSSSAAIKITPVRKTNEPIPVYDTSGPYGDPDISIDVRQGKARQPWIDADCAPLSERVLPDTKARLADDGLDELRFSGLLTPKRAVAGKMRYPAACARQG